MIAADFNGDGNLDLAAIGAGGVQIYNGNGSGSFVKGKAISPGGLGIDSSVTADFNGDGRPDIAGAGSGLLLALGTSTGSFKRELFVTSGSQGSLSVADFNHDGAPDIAVLGNLSAVTIYVNTGAVAATLSSSVNPSKVAQAVTLKVAVSPSLQGVTATPTGSITFKDGSAILATVMLKAGNASFTTTALAKRTHNISAAYSGDSNFIPTVSSTLVQVVQ